MRILVAAITLAAGSAGPVFAADPMPMPSPPGTVSPAPALATIPAAVADKTVAAIEAYSVPAKTIVEIEILDPISSKTAKIGDTFTIRLAEPLRIGDRLILPIGTAGRGEVTHVAKARWGGKAGELIVMVRYLQCAGQQIPLGHFHFGASGESHVGAAFGASMVVPFAGFLISGDEMILPAGTRGNAQVAKDVRLPPDAPQLCMKTQNL
jgi:hypothetical protein